MSAPIPERHSGGRTCSATAVTLAAVATMLAALTDEEFAEWTSAWQCTAPCCSEDAVEQGDGGGGGDE